MFPSQKSKGLQDFNAEFYQTFKEKLKPKLTKLFHKTEVEGTLSNSLYESTVTLIPKPHKDSKKKENCRSISLINMNAQIFNKILANKIQEHI